MWSSFRRRLVSYQSSVVSRQSSVVSRQSSVFNRKSSVVVVVAYSSSSRKKIMTAVAAVYLLLVLLCGAAHGFVRPARIAADARKSMSVTMKASPAAVFAAVALTTSLVLNGGSFAWADLSDEESDITMKVRTISVSSGPVAEATEGKKASAAAAAVTTTSSSSESDMDYGASLKKEKAKQEARKKDKVSRSRDLCESLGRGC